MMKTKIYVIISALIFACGALVHLVRLIQGWPVLLGTTSIPLWVSILAVIVAGGVAAWGFSLLRRQV